MAKVSQNAIKKKRIIGLVPAAGIATRLSPLPFSKELYPIGCMRFKGSDELRPKPVCIYLLEKMKTVGIRDVYIILRKDKWDIPAYLGDGSSLDMNLAYLMMGLPFGVPYTLNQAYPFIKGAIVAFGFPDIIFKPDNAYKALLTRQAKSKADLVLGLFPVTKPNKFHMVELNNDRQIEKIVLNPTSSHLKYTWIIAVWTQTFSHFMHIYLTDINREKYKIDVGTRKPKEKELYLSDIIQHAIDTGLKVEGEIFQEGDCIDIGTQEDLITATKNALDTIK